ncbi:cytosolic 5'-nucleotidase 1A [Centroberyx affinis]|uniref:cytosolic 5'-nucleotidase 1A n=1 Tax=Centroberyx affinis TaxID=166261 RepID=UPI003A5C32CA
MVSTVWNTDVKQKDADHAVVVAVASHAVFECGAEDLHSTEPYERGVAFPLIQAIQKVNDSLLEEDPAEALLFDVILLTSQSQDQHSRIIASTKHYGLDVGRFCLCTEEDFIETLLSNQVKLFLSTDTHDASKASHRGVASALLYRQTASHPAEQQQLRVLFSGDALDPPGTGRPGLSHEPQASIQQVASLLGEMRKRFSLFGSPLSLSLVTVQGCRETCGRALRTLRSWGVGLDEAYSLAGAPRGPILSLLKPHIVFTDGSGGSGQES